MNMMISYQELVRTFPNRAVSFGEHNRPLLPLNLQSKASPIESFKTPGKGDGGGSSGGSEEPSQ